MAISTIFLFIFITFGQFLFSSTASPIETKTRVSVLKEYTKYETVKNNTSPNFDLWKFEGNNEKLFSLFKSIAIQIEFDTTQHPEDFVLYLNSNKTQILHDYEAGQKIFGFLQKWSLWKSTRIFPFSPTFVGVKTNSSYRLSLKTTNVDFLLVFSFFGGIFLFFLAKKLSRNSAAFYFGGSSIGIFLSLMLVLFILYRLVPKRSIGISMLFGGGSFTLYLIYSIYQNIFMIFEQYQRFVACYLVRKISVVLFFTLFCKFRFRFFYVSVGLISFIICYRMGPPRDLRSQNLIQWSIQLISLIMIYAGCQIQSISAAVITIILIANNIPKSFFRTFSRLKYRFFPPKRRLLTEEEYIYQGMVETRKALSQLRDYCRSPECDSWRLMSRLDTPQRFASFVSGASHLNDQELLLHDADASADSREESDDDVEIESTRANGSLAGPSISQANGYSSSRHKFNEDSLSNLNRSSTSRFVERYSFGSPVNRSMTTRLGPARILNTSANLSEDDD